MNFEGGDDNDHDDGDVDGIELGVEEEEDLELALHENENQTNNVSMQEMRQQEAQEMEMALLAGVISIDEELDRKRAAAEALEREKMTQKFNHLAGVINDMCDMDLEDVNTIAEEAKPSDLVAGLMNSQINFYFHLVYFIGCLMVTRSSPMHCFKKSVDFHHGPLGSWYEYHDD